MEAISLLEGSGRQQWGLKVGCQRDSFASAYTSFLHLDHRPATLGRP